MAGAQIRRGDIYYIREIKRAAIGHEQRKERPAIVVSNDVGNKCAWHIEVVYLTTAQEKGLPTHVEIMIAAKISTALCEQITSVDRSRVGRYKGRLTEEEQKRIDAALAISIGLKEVVPKTGQEDRGHRITHGVFPLCAIIDKNGREICENDTLIDSAGNLYTVEAHNGAFYIRGDSGFTKDTPYSLPALTLWANKADTVEILSG